MGNHIQGQYYFTTGHDYQPSPSDDAKPYMATHPNEEATNDASLSLQQPPTPHKFWKMVCNDTFEPHRCHALIKNLTLQDDIPFMVYANFPIKFGMPCKQLSNITSKSSHHLNN